MDKYEVEVHYAQYKEPTFYLFTRLEDAIRAMEFAKSNGVYATVRLVHSGHHSTSVYNNIYSTVCMHSSESMTSESDLSAEENDL